MVEKKASLKKSKTKDFSNEEKILILSIDRDDDIGDKLNISGPVIGISKNKKLANDLATVDPEESDANCIFGAIKNYEFLDKENNVEIATLTGHSKQNLFYSDKNINEQLKKVLEKFPATGIVFVSDGAEDDQVIPIIQNYAPIISKETVIVRQSRGLESTFYTAKKALKDPFFSRIIFGVPAFILLLFVFFRNYAFEIIALAFGVYFLIKAFNLGKKFTNFFSNITTKFSFYRVSFPFYIAFLFLLVFSVIKGINLYYSNIEFELLFRIVYVIRAVLLYFLLAFISLIIGSIIDLFYLKKIYLLGKNIFALFAIFIFSLLIDLTLQLLIKKIDYPVIIYVFMLSIIFLVIIHKLTSLFDISSKITPLLIGLPVISKYGLWLGEVVEVNESNNTIKYKDRTNNRIKSISKKYFVLDDGRVII